MAILYPNLAAEMVRNGVDYGTLYKDVAEKSKRSLDTASNWFSTERPGSLPTGIAFYIRDKYFPGLTVDYLFNQEPISTENT